MDERSVRFMGRALIGIAIILGLGVAGLLYNWDSSMRTAFQGEATYQPSAQEQPPSPPNPPAMTVPESASAQAAAPSKGDTEAGKAIYAQYCNGCHPNGNAGLGPAIRGLADAMLEKITREGKGGMPAFKADRLNDKQLADMLAFIHTLK